MHLPIVLERFRNPYVGDHVSDGAVIGVLPMAAGYYGRNRSFYSGMELQTSEEPYRITVKYDFTGEKEFSAHLDRERTEKINVNPYILRQMDKNADWILRCIENAGETYLQVTGLDDGDAGITHILVKDRSGLK